MTQPAFYCLNQKKTPRLRNIMLFCIFLLSMLSPGQSQALWWPGTPTECKTEIKWERFVCILPRGWTEESFWGDVNVYNPYSCSPMDYYITAVDPATGTVNGTVTPLSGPLAAGWNAISFSYDPDPGVTAVRFLITFTCGGTTGYKVCRSTLGEFDKLDNRDIYPCRDYFKKAQAASVDHEAGILIAPNPASSSVRISYDIPGSEHGDAYQIIITNLLGQTVASYSAGGTQGIWQYDASQMSSGTYLVHLVKDGIHTDVQRMIIAH
jgi:hypothetical protein